MQERITLHFPPVGWLGLALALALVAGCSKHSPGPTEQNQARPDAAAMPPPSQLPPGMGNPTAAAKPAVVAPNADVNATLSQLALELRKYVMRTRSVPKNFDEFVAKSGIQVPPPPEGKKYAIDGQSVVLVKR
jgi:hypothetical protein